MTANAVTYAGRSIVTNRLKGNGTEPKVLAWGDCQSAGATIATSANSDVALFDPLPEARVTATSSLATTVQLGDTYQLVGTITATGSRGVREVIATDSTTASPTTTFTGSLTSGATGSQVVGSTTGFPGTGNFYCQLENEVIVASVADATHLSIVSRGALGSTAAAHSAGAVVTLGGDGGAGTGGATSAQTATVGSAQGGNAAFHCDFGAMSVNNGDSITFTLKYQLQ